MAGNGGDLLATFPNSILDVLEHYFTGNWVAFYGELGGILRGIGWQPLL